MKAAEFIIGFDGKRAAQNRTGLGNYSRFVVRGLSRYGYLKRGLLYVPNPSRTEALEGLDREQGMEVRSPQGWLWRRLCGLWRVWGITSQLKADGVTIFHGLSGELPLSISRARGVKSVVTVHDLIFLRFPQYYKRIDRWIYRMKFSQACKRADRIVAVSECTKRDIEHFFRVPAEKIEVIYQGCDERFRQPASEEDRLRVSQRYGLPERYILYVGSIEERKNLMMLARAMKLMNDREVEVIAVGRMTAYVNRVARFVEENGLNGRFHMIQGVPQEDLPALYQMAQVFVYPSRFEGFGIPLLEALCSGTPAIGCTGSCLEEAGGPDSFYVHPDDAEAMAHALERVLTDPELREHMKTCGLNYAERFRPEGLTRQLAELYSRISKNSVEQKQ